MMTLITGKCSLTSSRTHLAVFLFAWSVGFKNWAGGYDKFRFRVATCGTIVKCNQTCTPQVILNDHVIIRCSFNVISYLVTYFCVALSVLIKNRAGDYVYSSLACCNLHSFCYRSLCGLRYLKDSILWWCLLLNAREKIRSSLSHLGRCLEFRWEPMPNFRLREKVCSSLRWL